MLSQRKVYLLWNIRDNGKMTRDLLVAKWKCNFSKVQISTSVSKEKNLIMIILLSVICASYFFTNLCNPTSPAEVIELIKTFTHINIYVSLVRVSDLTTRALLQFSRRKETQ